MVTRATLTLFCVVFLGACAYVPAEEDVPELDLGPAVSAPEMPPGETPAPVPVTPRIVSHGSRNVRRVALTFDACSLLKQNYFDDRIVQTLVENKIPATFFLGGKWMQELPEQTRYLASIPQFELASHAFFHPHMKKLSDERVRQELRWTQQTMYALTGRLPTLFRAPYGETDARIVRLAAEAGLTTIEYDLPSGDASKNATAKKLLEYVGTVTKNGSIVVMHINGHGWHTAEALPQIIEKLRKRGFEFVTVSELMAPSESAANTVGNNGTVR